MGIQFRLPLAHLGLSQSHCLLVATFNFGSGSAEQSASTRIRLAGTQDVIAVAKMADGSFVAAAQTVKVTIGGCGG
jgi:sulfur-oxidizing protein SoxY